MNYKQWIKIWIITSCSIILTVGGFNYFVDPYGLNSSKNKYIHYISRTKKPSIVSLKINLMADYYLIGTSRVGRIDPNLVEKYLNNQQVYNVNIEGSTLRENYLLSKKIKQNGKNIIQGFDAFSLNKSRFDSNLILNRFETYRDLLSTNSIYMNYLSIDYLLTSITDIAYRIIGKETNQSYINENNREYSCTIEGVNSHLDISNDGPKKHFSNYEIVDEQEIINLAKIVNQDDIFIIFPMHYYHYILFQKYQDIESKYFKAIKLLVENTDAKVWSFYQINDITKQSHNFDKDGWHFKPKIADLMFGRIFNDTKIEIPNEFGVLLTKDNIIEYLENLKKDIENYDSGISIK